MFGTLIALQSTVSLGECQAGTLGNVVFGKSALDI